MNKKRWLILGACCLINLCLGSIYAWSVFSASMSEYLSSLTGTEHHLRGSGNRIYSSEFRGTDHHDPQLAGLMIKFRTEKSFAGRNHYVQYRTDTVRFLQSIRPCCF